MMKKLSSVFLLCFLVGVAANTLARDLDLNLSNDASEVNYVSPYGGLDLGSARLSLGFLYTEPGDYLLSSGLHVEDEAGTASPGLSAGVGVGMYSARIGKDDIFAIGLGGSARYNPPAIERLFFSVEGHYAPDIVTFIDGDSFLQLAVRGGYEILPQAEAYLGYRKVRVGIRKASSATIDSGLHIGVTMVFD